MTADDFKRTANRRDYAVPPPEPTLCDRAVDGRPNASSASARSATSSPIAASATWSRAPTTWRCSTPTLAALDRPDDGDLVFANLVDFDSLYGHRRDVPGYAAALEAFDRRLPELEAAAEARRPGG